jgi:hypothetical protein
MFASEFEPKGQAIGKREQINHFIDSADGRHGGFAI